MTKVPVRTYSLKEIATQICGDDLKGPERWVLRRIYAGKFRAIKVGRSYRMTEEQLDEALAALEIKPTTVTSPTPPSGPTPASRRRQEVVMICEHEFRSWYRRYHIPARRSRFIGSGPPPQFVRLPH
jgi:hypothetical protein